MVWLNLFFDQIIKTQCHYIVRIWGIIGSYFFENGASQTTKVTGAWLNDNDVDDKWFQQDGATCHSVSETI